MELKGTSIWFSSFVFASSDKAARQFSYSTHPGGKT